MGRRKRLIELGKDLLILLLSASAVWLAARNQFLGPVSRMMEQNREEDPGPGQSITESRADAARPLRMAACLTEGREGLYGILCDSAAADELFEQTAVVLTETLTSAGAPEPLDRSGWESALQDGPGIMLDFQGSVPLSVLAGWLSGAPVSLDTSVRRLVLSAEEEGTAISCQDADTGEYFRIRSQVASPSQLTAALRNLSLNGAFYAFQSEGYGDLDPDTLLTADMPEPAVCTAFNPMSAGGSSLEELLDDLGIPANANGIYQGAGGEWVARTGSGTLRLSDRGVTVFEAGEDLGDMFQTGSGENASLYEQVEACRRVAYAALDGRTGQARPYLLDTEQTEDGLSVTFGLQVGGIPVMPDVQNACSFLVREGRIERFEIRFRGYSPGEETLSVLPPRQAAAALRSENQTGAEMLLVYEDTGAERVEPGWAAVRRGG